MSEVLHYARLAAWLAKIEYKPGWRFYITASQRKPGHSVLFVDPEHAADSTGNRPGTFKSENEYLFETPQTELELRWAVFRSIVRVERHEVFEWLKFDGEHFVKPHAPELLEPKTRLRPVDTSPRLFEQAERDWDGPMGFAVRCLLNMEKNAGAWLKFLDNYEPTRMAGEIARRICEQYIAQQDEGSKMPDKFCCSECGGTNVQVTSWVNVNTWEPVDSDPPTNDVFCADCDSTHVSLIEREPVQRV